MKHKPCDSEISLKNQKRTLCFLPETNLKSHLPGVSVDTIISANLWLCCYLYSCWRPRRSGFTAAADVTVITAHLHTSDRLCDWTADTLPQCYSKDSNSNALVEVKVLFIQFRLQRTPENRQLKPAFTCKVAMLTECIRWPHPGQSQSREVLLLHMERNSPQRKHDSSCQCQAPRIHGVLLWSSLAQQVCPKNKISLKKKNIFNFIHYLFYSNYFILIVPNCFLQFLLPP